MARSWRLNCGGDYSRSMLALRYFDRQEAYEAGCGATFRNYASDLLISPPPIDRFAVLVCPEVLRTY
jgi:hypothetical protein